MDTATHELATNGHSHLPVADAATDAPAGEATPIPSDRRYLRTRPVRAEQYRVGMDRILGCLVATDPNGVTSFRPFTPRCVLADGDWVVEVGETQPTDTGMPQVDGMAVRVVPDKQFRADYRQAHPGEVRGGRSS